MPKTKSRLTAAEIASLWTNYINDSGSICILSYFREKTEDHEVKKIIDFALQLSIAHINKLELILTEEKHAVPIGFSFAIT